MAPGTGKATIGAVITDVFVIILTAVSLVMGANVSGVVNSLIQYAVLGALVGAIFRALVWPLWAIVRRNWRSRKDAAKSRRDEFVRQKQRVEARLQRGRDDDPN